MKNLPEDGMETEYKVGGFHFHTGSEHLFDGKRLAIEMHLGHHSETPYPHDVVIALFFDSDLNEESVFLNQLNLESIEVVFL